MLTCDDCPRPLTTGRVASRGNLHLDCWIMRALRTELAGKPVGGTLTERLARVKS